MGLFLSGIDNCRGNLVGNMFDCLSDCSSFISGSSSSAFIDECLHDFSEEYLLLNMDFEVECWILSESTNEAISCKKGCCGRDVMNFGYEGFPHWKSVDVSECFTEAPFNGFHFISHFQLF